MSSRLINPKAKRSSPNKYHYCTSLLYKKGIGGNNLHFFPFHSHENVVFFACASDFFFQLPILPMSFLLHRTGLFPIGGWGRGLGGSNTERGNRYERHYRPLLTVSPRGLQPSSATAEDSSLEPTRAGCTLLCSMRVTVYTHCWKWSHYDTSYNVGQCLYLYCMHCVLYGFSSFI